MSQLLRLHSFMVSRTASEPAKDRASRAVDTLHVAVAPVDLGRGERLWDSPDELLDRYHLDRVPSPSGVTHLLYWRR